VFGCGGDRDRGKRPVMGEIASLLADTVILTNDNPRSESPASILGDIESGLVPHGCYEIVPDRAEAIARAGELATAADIILVAGKGHESTQIMAGDTLPFSDREQVEKVLGGGL
jgi:UDP-N-acetylmuramoyl-L-alanyl-D-glutamate--2,6-diaminopimelate ligase